MRNVHLYGHLAKKFGKTFRLHIATVGEAVRALSTNFPEFLVELKKGHYEIVRGNKKDGLRLDIEDVNTFQLGNGDLHIVPVIAGAKNSGGVLKAVLGVALIGAAVFFSGGALATPIAGGLLGGATYGNMAMLGLAVALAGVSSMLTSTKKKDESDASYTINGPTNTYEQGAPVPLIYGEVITGGVMISAGMDIENIGAFTG